MLDPSIPLGVQQPKLQLPDPVEQYSKALTIRTLLGQQDLQQYALSKAQREDAMMTEFQNHMKNLVGHDNIPEIARAMIATGNPEYVQHGAALQQKWEAAQALRNMAIGLPPNQASNPMDPTGANPSIMAGAPGTAAPTAPAGSSAALNPRVLALLGMGDAATTKAAELLNTAEIERRKFVPGRAGAPMWGQDANGNPIQIGFNPRLDEGMTLSPTGVASTVPGYLAAKTANIAATEGAKSAFQTEPVMQPSGAVVPTFKPQIPGYPGRAPAASAALPAAVPPADAPAYNYVAQRDAQGLPATANMQGPGGTLNTAAAVPSGMPDPWATIPKLPVGTGIGQSTFDKTLATQSGEVAGKLSEKYGASSDAANQRIALNNQAMELVDKADTGPYAARIADVKNLLVSRFGIPESSFANTPSATLALNKDLVNAATQRAKQQFGTRITQSEVMLMLNRGAPNVDMPKAAIKYLLNSDNAAAGYSIQQANDLGKYIQSGGDPTRFEGWYAKNFPMTDAMKNVPGVNAPPAPTRVNSLSQADPLKYEGQIATGDDGVRYKAIRGKWVRQ